jgi:F-type H+-transporting ATPase subunit epsilon
VGKNPKREQLTMAAPLTVSIVSADQQIWSGKATMVVAKTTEGEIGILTGHEPLLAILASGEVRVTLPEGDKIIAHAEDGFLSVENNNVTIVARQAALAS